ncbi:lamin tail domain-containing protein [Adhaeribacter aquaticus]|uniref:lamin tail domain-containing protein n=1 Tax=Adhaeribacter aquaticus TaxID=299567 RepID=UPI000426A3B2|nr:lamin tail domain-containing protein [Adhaeribacter aquaticus]
MRKFLSVWLFFYQLLAFGQLQENFSDGDFTQHPAWTGDQQYFQVNAGKQLQSNGPAVTGSIIQLVTPLQVGSSTTWEFYAEVNLATSSGNYADVFLMSDIADLKGGNKGYFVRIGGTPDEVSLFRKDGAATPVYVINGPDRTISSSTSNKMRIRVSWDAQHKWTLWLDITGSGLAYAEQGNAVDATYRTSAYFGFLLRYSAANSKKFIFDDIEVRDTTPIDVTPPVVQQVTVTNSRSLQVKFNEPVSNASAQIVANYLINNGIGQPITATLAANDASLVNLNFAKDFFIGTNNLTINNVEDVRGNKIATPITTSFNYTPVISANYRDVRINEIMADYNPTVGLPGVEYIELYNSSNKTLNLKDWQYSDATTATARFPAYNLAPGTFVLLSRPADTTELKSYGKVLGLPGFPTLNDAGDAVEIFDNTGKLIDKIIYTTAAYKDTRKAEGGWSLELINPTNSCGNIENYIASVHPDGGTPGRQNSVYNTTPDTQAPALLRYELITANQIKLTFSEPLDSVSSRNISTYAVSGGMEVITVVVPAPEYKAVYLMLQANLQPRQTYTVTIRDIRDCPGNATTTSITLALPESAGVGDVIINEILFNPKTGGVDFVEVVNRSPKFIDLKNCQLGNEEAGVVSNLRTISSESFIVAPQQYIVLTTHPDIVQAHYPGAVKESFLRMSSLPAYPNDAGVVVLSNDQKVVIDRVAYNEKMHLALLDDVNGVSLERIKLEGDSSAANWHSAASTVGYATPGFRNSQYFEQTPFNDLFSIEPKIFTPDGDGIQDFTTINYQASAIGFIANITIYNGNGRRVKHLVKNETLAATGFFQWDGVDERGYKVPVGAYILYIEIFNLSGQVKAYKETVVVGAQF